MLQRFLSGLVFLGMAGGVASAAVTYDFEAGQSSYSVAPGGVVEVPIYLKETLTEGSPSQIAADDGLYSFGITVDLTSGGGQIQDLARNPVFDRRNNGSTTAFPADPARLWADQDVNFGSGPDPDGSGRILLATLSFQAPNSGSATLSIGDFQGVTDETVTYAFNALDAQIAPGSFSVVAEVPEPASIALLALLPAAALLRRRGR